MIYTAVARDLEGSLLMYDDKVKEDVLRRLLTLDGLLESLRTGRVPAIRD